MVDFIHRKKRIISSPSRFSLFQGFPVFFGRDACLAFKEPGKIVGVFKPQKTGNIKNIIRKIGQHDLGCIYF